MLIGFGLSLMAGLKSSASPAALFAGGEVGVWYDPSDLTTLFQDSAGTTPVTTAGQPVGLMLDKSKGSTFGADIVTNGDFSGGSTGWTLGTGVTISGGIASFTAGSGYLSQLIATEAGRAYKVTATAGINNSFSMANNNANQNGVLPLLSGGTSAAGRGGTFSFIFVASDTTSYIDFTPVGSLAGTLDNVSVIPLPLGNHATQATAAQRPTYGIHPYSGVRNRANGSAAYDNATYWPASSTVNGITATRTAGSDAQGSYVDVRFVSALTTGTAQALFYVESFSRSPAASGETFTASAIVERIATAGSTAGINGILTGVVWETAPNTFIGLQLSGYANSATPTTITATRAIPSGNQVRTFLSLDVAVGSTIDVTYRIRDFQFEKSATRTAYQANFSQYNITEAGVPSVHYLGFDGVDDGMVTSAINFSATDAVTVFTGLRKLSDAAGQAALVELTSGGFNRFTIFAPQATSGVYRFVSGGTLTNATDSAAFTAPDTAVLSGSAKISTNILALRRNGSDVAFSNFPQGTGNYANAPLYIGRRGGATLPYNGNIYSLIVRGVESTAGQITSTETWVNGKTGAY